MINNNEVIAIIILFDVFICMRFYLAVDMKWRKDMFFYYTTMFCPKSRNYSYQVKMYLHQTCPWSQRLIQFRVYNYYLAEYSRSFSDYRLHSIVPCIHIPNKSPLYLLVKFRQFGIHFLKYLFADYSIVNSQNHKC